MDKKTVARSIAIFLAAMLVLPMLLMTILRGM